MENTSLNRTVSPDIKDAVDFELQLKPFEKYILDNGTEVYAIHTGEQEVMMLELVFDAGNWYEETSLVASATNYLLKNGTSAHRAFEINEHFEYYGAYVNRHCYNETATVSVHCLSKHFHELVPWMEEMIADSVFPEEELNIFKQNSKQKLAVSLQKCDFVANRLIDSYLYGVNHPYGKFSSKEEYDALQREQLRDYFDKYYRNGKCRIFAAGRLPENFLNLLNTHFGKLQVNRKALPEIQHQPEPATEKKYRINNDPKGLQGAIRIARPFPNRHHPDFPKVQVLNALFGGFFGSRLMSNIREDKGYTYGIYSYLQNHVKYSSWVVSTEAGKEVCDETIREIYAEMKRLRVGFVLPDELKVVKNYLLGTLLGDLDGPFHIIGRWKNIILNGLDENYFYNSIQVTKTITVEELQQLARQYLNPEDFYELVVV